MTDNRTTELRISEPLRGFIRHQSNRAYIDGGQARWLTEIADEIDARHEQAIAATLGRPKAKSHPYGYERDTGAYDCTSCECGCVNDISATYCNDCGGEIEIDVYAEKEIYRIPRHLVFAEKHDDGSLEFCERRYVPEDAATLGSGTLTAEQVREAIEKRFDFDVWVPKERWQAIADELNARAERTCKVVASYDTADVDSRGSNAEWYFAFSCGCELYWDEPAPPNYCPSCGARIEVDA